MGVRATCHSKTPSLPCASPHKGARLSLDLLKETGVPLDQQRFTWKELAGPGLSKLNDDAFSRVRIILLNGVEAQAVRFSHSYARMDEAARVILAKTRRIDHHQQTLVNWLLPADQS